MGIDRFTGFGLAIALLGWAVLIGNAVVSPLANDPVHMAAAAGLRADVFTLAQATIVTGFGLAIIGVLRSGFGALHRFFDAVLERASGSRPAAAAPRPAPMADTEPTMAPVVELTPERPPAKPQKVAGRNYTILDNGAVEVETLLGTRVFASLDEARDYLR